MNNSASTKAFDQDERAIFWYRANTSATPAQPLEFTLEYSNHTGDIAALNQHCIGTKINRHTTSVIADAILFSKVFTSGIPEQQRFVDEAKQAFYNVVFSCHNNGVLVVWSDSTDWYKPADETRKQAERYKIIIDSSADGILLLNCIRNEHDDIVDFHIAHYNAVGCNLARFPEDALGKTLLEILPHLAGGEQYNLHKQVVETGKPVQFETTFRNDKGEEYGWFIVLLQKLDDGVLSRFTDITDKKNDEEKIKDQASLLNSILDASTSSIFAMQAVRNEHGAIVDFKFLKTNQQFLQYANKSITEITGCSYLNMFPASEHNGMFEMKVRVAESGIPHQQDIYYNHDGIDGWFNVSLTRLGIDGVVEAFVDVTESKKDKERLRTIINTSRAGMFTLKPLYNEEGAITDFTIGLVNKAVAKFFNTTTEQLSGALASVYYPLYHQNGLFNLYTETFVEGMGRETEFHMQNGVDLYFNVRTDRLDEEILVTFTDQTPLKKLQLQLQKSIEELKRSNNSLEAFTSAASHDLKEPIRKINFFVSLLKSRFPPEGSDSFQTFEKLQTATQRMIVLVDDLLEYAHLSHTEPQFTPINLNEQMAMVQENLELLIEEKGALLRVYDLPVIFGFKLQVQQLFQNLISNSLKYSRPDVPPVITITSSTINGKDSGIERAGNKAYYLVEVVDNGIGFEQKYAERIFNVFERLHAKNEYKGSGVGLSIARKVMDNHNGFIAADSTPGNGATFRIYFPVIDALMPSDL